MEAGELRTRLKGEGGEGGLKRGVSLNCSFGGSGAYFL
jgi:hypothetical protein